MKKLLEKLNYKGDKRIAVLNAEENFITSLVQELGDATVDREVDPRFPYHFILIFVRNQKEAEKFIPVALHNLQCDGVLWFCYPKKSARNNSDIDRDHGWNALNKAGFHGVRMVSIDDQWSGLRFRSIKFIKSVSGRFAK